MRRGGRGGRGGRGERRVLTRFWNRYPGLWGENYFITLAALVNPGK